MSNVKFVLVKWTGKGEEGQMHGVNLEWVRGWENVEFDADGEPNCSGKSVVIEWRVGKFAKETGWALYPGSIIRGSRTYKSRAKLRV